VSAKPADPELMVVLFGVNRALSITHPNLQRQVLEPLERQAVRHGISWAFNEIGALRNPRSREVGLSTEFDSARALKALQGTLLDQEYVDRITQPDFEAAAASGDPWDDGFVSLRNHLRYLYVLQVSSQQALALAPHCRWFFFVRPDLLFAEPLDLAGLIASHPDPHQEVLVSASWQRWGGTNDRFALATRGAAETYGLRYGQIGTFLRQGVGPLHAEIFLQWCLDQRPEIRQSPSISATAHRVRCKESPQLLAAMDLSLPGLVAAQRAVLGSVQEWMNQRSPEEIKAELAALDEESAALLGPLLEGLPPWDGPAGDQDLSR
jgi:hypothetical protein